MSQFDKFCVAQFPDVRTITPELGLAWSTKKDSEGMSTLEGRVAVVRELARYMNRCGVDAFVIPRGVGGRAPRYAPHIFTSAELRKFFNVLDQMGKSRTAPIHHLVYPVLFRLLYSCGLRPYEAICLACEHVDLKGGMLFIEQSKGHRDRYVALSNDMLALMRNYRNLVSTLAPPSLYFFPNAKGGQLNSANLNRVFCKCWQEAEIPGSYGNPPRVYDFRHSFATKRLYLWNEEGKDLNAYLPYLSAFMGHTHLSATAYYIHLTPEFFPKRERRMLQAYDDLIPEVCND